MKKWILSAVTAAALVVGALVVHAQNNASSTAAYETLGGELKELNDKANRLPTLEAKLQVVDEMTAKLLKFRTDYAGTPEADDAAFQLGMLKQSVASMTQDEAAYKDALKYLSVFITSNSAARDKLAFAHYYMGESYRGMNAFDDAEKEYKLILNDFGGVSPKLTQFAQMNLADLETERKLSIGAEPLAFSVKSITGEALSPEKYKGKVLLLDFWATWCGPCKAEMPNVKKVYSKYNNKGFENVGISLDRSRDALENYISQNKIEWPQYFDGKYWNNDIATQYGVKQIPTTFLIDKKGKIRYKSLRGKQLDDAVARLLSEEM